MTAFKSQAEYFQWIEEESEKVKDDMPAAIDRLLRDYLGNFSHIGFGEDNYHLCEKGDP